MEYNKIISISGLPGLFEMLSSKTDGAIVRSLDDQSVKFISSRVHNFSQLEGIEVYTNRENVSLAEVFMAIDKAGEKLPSDKDAAAVKTFFQKVYPEMDFTRVYNSDMKKMVKWYSQLKTNDVEIKLRELPTEEEVTEDVTEAAAPAKETKAEEAKAKPAAKKTAKAATEEVVTVDAAEPAKKTRAKKAATKKEDGAEEAGTEEKPKKKVTTTRKKKTEEE